MKRTAKIIIIALSWVASLILVFFLGGRLQNVQTVDSTTVVNYEMLYNGSLYVPFDTYAEKYNVQAEVSVISSSKGAHFVCSAENDGTSLGGIDFTVKDNTISDFLMDGALCRMGNNSSDELVIVIGNQVYINEDAYSAFLSELS